MEGFIPFRLALHTAEEELPFGGCDLGNSEKDEFVFGDNYRVCPSTGLVDQVGWEERQRRASVINIGIGLPVRGIQIGIELSIHL